MGKTTTGNFVVQFRLIAEPFQIDVLNKRMEIGRKIYNSIITIVGKQYREMIKTNQYRNIKAELKDSLPKK
ncbi:hypothetical protein RBH29_14870 [Herbivorax sp. ANBcel31]|uniref:hypothetical protein n=1 Tax=Herbivorax sp. ANBcel31 TaxID=3069754 RepID=UPI0027B067DB|nr:hypothetical protein [Herbivorax sp. ANBcel31]MDQ2087710.1 hypothetical protein [Herbivorax sp. ANBcel31]